MPVWGTKKVLVHMKGSGMKAIEATKLFVEMADGKVASKKEEEALVVWPSARLRIVFGESVGWYGRSRGAWHDQATALAVKLAPLAKPQWIVQDIIGRNDIPVLKAVPFKSAEAKKLAGRVLFDHQKQHAWACMRSGGPRDVRWDASVLVRQRSLQLHLPPTDANLRLLGKTLDALVAKSDVPFAWATVGRGWDGWASAMALSANDVGPKTSVGGTSLVVLRQDLPKDGVDSLLWLGRAWCSDEGIADDEHEKLIAPVASGKGRTVTRTRENGLVRVSVPEKGGKALGADLAKVVSKVRDVARRAVLRKRG